MPHLLENTADAAGGFLHADDGGDGGGYIVNGDALVVAAGFDAGAHEDDGDVIVVVEGGTVGGSGAGVKEIEGFLDDNEVRRPTAEEAVLDSGGRRTGGHLSVEKLLAGVDGENVGNAAGGCGSGALDFSFVELL